MPSVRRKPRAVVKLGGSVITDKRGDRPRIRRKILARLAGELAEAPAGRVVGVVHGAGSFGHGPVKRAGIHQGVRTSGQRLAWGEIQVLQNELNAAVCRALLSAGLPAVPCQASASAVLDRGKLVHLDDTALRELTSQKMVPVLYGVPAPDRQQGCAILSGDVLAPELARILDADLLILGTDVDGVYTADPRKDPAAKRLDHITPRTWPTLSKGLAGAAATDVTGGMRGKISTLLDYIRQDPPSEPTLRARIVDARQPGRLLEALRNRPVGTLVSREPMM